MSILLLTCDWTLVDQMQSWFESCAASRQLLWRQRLTAGTLQDEQIELMIIDSRLKVSLGDYPVLKGLVERNPTVWLAYPGHDNLLDLQSTPVGQVLLAEDLSRAALIRARERAIGIHEQQTRRRQETQDIDNRVAQLLKQWVSPLTDEVSGLRQTLGWLRILPAGQSTTNQVSQRSAIQTEVQALRKRTEQLSRQLDKVRDLSSLLSSRFSTSRTPFCLPTLVREVAARHPSFQVPLETNRHETAAAKHLAFADPGQIRCCLEEIILSVEAGEGSALGRSIELSPAEDQDHLRIIVWDGSPLDPDTFRRLRDRWLDCHWSVASAEPDFLLGLGLTRERLRHNGGDLQVVQDVEKGVGLELTIPSSRLRSVLGSQQSLLRSKLPQLTEATLFAAQLDAKRVSAAARSAVTEFMQRYMGSLGVAIPLDSRNWAILAPVEAAERDRFLEWLGQQWRQFIAAESQPRAELFQGMGLKFACMATLAIDAPVEVAVQRIQSWFNQKLSNEVVNVTDEVRQDNRRLQETTTELSGPHAHRPVEAASAGLGGPNTRSEACSAGG